MLQHAFAKGQAVRRPAWHDSAGLARQLHNGGGQAPTGLGVKVERTPQPAVQVGPPPLALTSATASCNKARQASRGQQVTVLSGAAASMAAAAPSLPSIRPTPSCIACQAHTSSDKASSRVWGSTAGFSSAAGTRARPPAAGAAPAVR